MRSFLIAFFLLVVLVGVAYADYTVGISGNSWDGSSDIENLTENLGNSYQTIGIFADNFDDGNENWVDEFGTSTVSTFQNYTRPYSLQTEVGDSATHTFPSNGDGIALSLWNYHAGTNNQRGSTIALLDTSTQGPRITFHNDGWLKTYDGVWNNITTYTGNQWNFILMVAYPSTDTFDIYFEGTWYGPFNFLNNQVTLDKIQISNYVSDIDSYSDDIRIFLNTTTSGNATIWYDYGSNGNITSAEFNFSGDYINYTTLMRQNATGEFQQIGGVRTTNATVEFDPYYNNSDVRVVINSNTTLSSQLISMKLITTPAPLPLNPIIIKNETWLYGVNVSWGPGGGNVTDGYNITNGTTWWNQTAPFLNVSGSVLEWINLTIYPYNLSDSILGPSLTVNTQISPHVPFESDFNKVGQLIPNGSSGDWDFRTAGAMSTGSVLKINSTYYWYYIGSETSGAVNRSVGVAYSSDGTHWKKYSNNPIYFYSTPGGSTEEGIFSVVSFLDPWTNEVLLYVSEMADLGGGQVNSSISLLVSNTTYDPYNFTRYGEVINEDDSSIWGYGDELFPAGVYVQNGIWNLFYIAKGGAILWDLGVANGTAREGPFDTYSVVTDVDINSPVSVSRLTHDLLLLIYKDNSGTKFVRTFNGTIPTTLSTVRSYTDADIHQPFMRYGTGRDWWMLVYENISDDYTLHGLIANECVYTVSGYVKYENGTGINGSTLSYGSVNATTDGTGFYSLSNMMNISYNFTVNVSGYDNEYLNVTVSGADNTTANITFYEEAATANYTREISQVVSITDTSSKNLYAVREPVQNISVIDTVLRSGIISRGISQSISISDTVNQTLTDVGNVFSRAVSITFTTSENISRAATFQRIATQTVSVSNKVSRLSTLTREVSQSITASDTITKFKMIIRTVLQSLTIADDKNINPIPSSPLNTTTVSCPSGWCYLAMNYSSKTLQELDDTFTTDVVQGWFNASTQRPESHRTGNLYNGNVNVPEKWGYWYYFASEENINITFGANPTITLKNGWNLVGNYQNASRTLEQLKTDIGVNATGAQYYSKTTKLWESANDTVVPPGEAFYVTVSSDTEWGG